MGKNNRSYLIKMEGINFIAQYKLYLCNNKNLSDIFMLNLVNGQSIISIK